MGRREEVERDMRREDFFGYHVVENSREKWGEDSQGCLSQLVFYGRSVKLWGRLCSSNVLTLSKLQGTFVWWPMTILFGIF